MSNATRATTFRRAQPLVGPLLCVILVLAVLPDVPAVLFLSVLVASTCVVAYRFGNYLLTTLSTAFLFRLALIAIDSEVGVLPEPPIMSEHNRRAITLATAWSDGHFLGVLGSYDLMRVYVAHALAPFYLVFGHSPVSGRIAIAFIGLLMGYLAFRIARVVTTRRRAVLAATAVLFWPTVVARSVVIQREVIVAVALLAFLWASARWLDSVTAPSVAVASLSAASMWALREENLLLIAVLVGFVALVKSRDRPYYLLSLFLLVVPFSAFFARNFRKFTGFGTSISPEAIDAFAYGRGRASGDAAYLVGFHYESWLDIALYAPVKVLYFLYTPFPWQVGSVTELFVAVSALGLLAATLCVRRGIGTLREEPHYLGLLGTYLVTGVVTYSIVEMNYGAAVRRRIQFVPILLLLAVLGLATVDFDIRGGME